MSLQGMAFLPIWHGIDAEADAEFNRWHTVEHMPERLYTPGILVGRRYAKPEARHRYFTLYEAASFEVFSSEGYFATANARSEWTQRVHPHFRDFVRAPCHLVMTRGRGIGGALATIRVHFAAAPAAAGPDPVPTAKDMFNLAARHLVESIAALDMVTSVHAGVTAPVGRLPLSKESLSLRPHAMAFDGVLMVESIGRAAMLEQLPAVEKLLQAQSAAVASYEVDLYDLAHVIAARDG